MAASTLDGRLLCASGSAYAISGTESVLAPDPSNVSIAGAGFLRPPSVVIGGPLEIDAGLVGEITDGFVVAFPATLAFDLHKIPTWRDWVSDFQALPATVTGFPGSVHSGFAAALAVLGPLMLAELTKQQAGAAPGRPVFVTGHSKGGAMAPLFAWSLLQAGIKPTRVVTFAGAKPADAVFSQAYNAAGIDHARYEYDNDIVPHLPLSDGGFVDVLAKLPVIGSQYTVADRFDYQPVGPLLYITASHQIVPDDATLRSRRDLALAIEILELHLAQIASDHSISCGSGYMTAVAPSGVCP